MNDRPRPLDRVKAAAVPSLALLMLAGAVAVESVHSEARHAESAADRARIKAAERQAAVIRSANVAKIAENRAIIDELVRRVERLEKGK